MDAVLASVAVLFVVGGLPAKGNEPENSTTSRSKIPEGFYLSASDIHAKHITILEMKNVSFTGRELDAFEISHLSVDEKCSRGLPLSAAWQYYGPYVRPGMRDGKVAVEGIFPHIINKMLHVCCNSSTTVKYGKIFDSIRGLEGQLNQPETAYDFSFPVTGKSLGDESFKDLPYIPIVQAPRVALLVRDKTENTKTAQLMNTVFKAWPILIFILVAATLSGIIIWLLDRLKNPDEFPRPFINGTWEGFWWAFVTMTTVGYGDRAPKSFLARIFCILWILVGIIIIAIFTAIVTASLSASIQHHFTVHGSVIGAVSASEEFRLGVSLNADLKPYLSIPKMNEDLMTDKLKGSLIDNYVLTYYSDFVKENDVRIETTFEHAITYGLSIRSNASSNMLACFRRYVRNHPQEAFEIIAQNLEPLKNPTDEVSQEVKASEGLFFYREKEFKKVLFILLGVLGFLLFVGGVWELCYNRPRRRQRKEKENDGELISLTPAQNKCDCHEMLLSHQTIQSIKYKSTKIKELIREYEEFYDEWLQRVRAVEHNENGITPQMV
ncbi:hypothetical protein ABFA07_015015 [Porites harrisoni]